MTEQSLFKPATIPDGKRIVDDNVYMNNGEGGLDPVETIKPQDLLQDEVVRKILGFWIAASDQISRLKEHVVSDLDDFEALLAQEYDTSIGGKRGNKTFFSIDRLFRVEVRISDHIDFGPELQIAKALVDECVNDWASDARPEIRAIVNSAFQTEVEGKVNRSELIKLTKLDIEDERWQRGMKAIRDAQRVVGSKTYIRCYRRDAFDGPWSAVPIDMAKA
ncbi:hypothetical protein ASD8599_01749 [Ascidiaceihabitans donghaensis]|uniref:Sulfate transporter n=1 Tax=Ascidiaceihabitans donghaensis TaxID=1510460 RepID=A0A2R8BD49_9RHOB|nr:DUF3164 family protein [Ascidiaceihabitans donghaensis]SPH21008.1 hypothetical protein ASD8599_01749 [Ascidiaceihabitans donghaensis]